MKKKLILCGVCTIALILAAAVSVVSCSNDDEYYEGGNYTLAYKRVTRSVEPGGVESSTVVGSDTIYTNYQFIFSKYPQGTVSIDMMIYRMEGKPVAHMLSYDIPYGIELVDSTFRVTGVGFEEDNKLPKRYYLCAYARDSVNTIHVARINGRIFY